MQLIPNVKKGGPDGMKWQGHAGHSSRPDLALPCQVARQQSPTPFHQAKAIINELSDRANRGETTRCRRHSFCPAIPQKTHALSLGSTQNLPTDSAEEPDSKSRVVAVARQWMRSHNCRGLATGDRDNIRGCFNGPGPCRTVTGRTGRSFFGRT